MRMLVALALASTPVLAQTAAPAPAPAPAAAAAAAPAAAGWMQQWDELWKTRDQAASLTQLHQILEKQLAADPKSFEANWRLASLFGWEANGEEGDKKA